MNYSFREALGRLFYIIPAYPHQAQLEVTNRCNLSCVMCPRDYFKVPQEDMSLETFKEIVHRLQGVSLLTLTGWGEPLVHPQIFEMIRYGKARGYKVTLTTNGTLLTPPMREKIIASGLDAITISLESTDATNEVGHCQAGVLPYVKELVKERHHQVPHITLQATLHQGRGQDVYGLIRFGKEAGVARINLGRLDVRYSGDLARPDAQEEKQIMQEADRLGSTLGIQVDCIQSALFNGVPRVFYKCLKSSLHRFGKYCLRLYDYIYITQEGEITPCCGMPRYRVGNIFEEELRTIWRGKDFHYFREHHHQLCGSCDLWRIEYQR